MHIYQYLQQHMQSSFDSEITPLIVQLGQDVLKKYSRTIQAYKNHIIPFECNRMNSSQTLSFKNSTLERDKNELVQKLQKQQYQKRKLAQTVEKHQQTILSLEEQIKKIKSENEEKNKLLQALKVCVNELQTSLNMKVQLIKQMDQDKQQVLRDYQEKNNDYNILLANYMKDKNYLAQKLNSMNELQTALLEKQKELKSQKFLIQKQWQELQQSLKQSTTDRNGDKMKSIIPDRPLNRRSIFNQKQQHEEKKKPDKAQILRTPLKKIYKHHQSEIYDISFNYNGNLLATCGGDRQVKIYDVLNLKSGVTIQSYSAENVFISAELNYNGDRVLTGATNKTIQIFNTQNGKQLNSFLGHGQKINSVTWSCTRQKCVSGADDKQIKVWDIEKGANSLSISCGKTVKKVVCNTVEPVVYSGHSDGSVRIYSINQGSVPVSQIKGIIDYPITQLSLLSNRYHVLASSQEGTIINLLDLKMNKSLAKYEHKDYFNTQMKADISPTQTYIVAGNCDGTIFYWNRDKKTMQRRVSGHQGPITMLRYQFMTGFLASADNEGNLILWQ